MTVLVLAEHDNNELNPATLNVLAAAKAIAGDVDLLVAGEACSSVVQKGATVDGVRKVLHVEGQQYAHALAATTTGKNVMPRVAALLDVAQISDVIAIVGGDTFDRPIYAGNIIATVKSSDEKKVITVRTTAFDPLPVGSGSAEIVQSEAKEDSKVSEFVGEELTKSDRPELGAADIIVSGGRGVGSSEDFAIIEALADKLGAAVGASRAAVDAGYVPNDYQVGQTGKVVAPQLYVAVGISGAIQHLAGMKDSKVIVAINKDEEAPIFGVADYGLVGDLFKEVPAMTESLSD